MKKTWRVCAMKTHHHKPGRKVLFLPAIIVLMLPFVLWAEVKPHALFCDGAVLQRGIAVPVWGTAGDGEKVMVKFAAQTVTTTAHNGEWCVRLKPMGANASPQTMTVSGVNTVTIKNLLVGDVWVCGGQSNMEFPLAREDAWKSGVENAQEVIAKADDPLLRLFTVPRCGNACRQRDVGGKWNACTREAVAGFSAVGYFFGRDLRKAEKVPIGLISSNVAGSPAERWVSQRALGLYPALSEFVAAQPLDNGPSSYYNAMIAPLQPFAITGVVWYQGESNNDRAAQYLTLFPALIKCWREEWGQGDFPFLFVQIALHNDMKPEIRDAQLSTWRKTLKTAMVVTTDCGAVSDIHPRMKEPVGARLALAARAVAYGEQIEYSGPVVKAIRVEGCNAILTFTHTGGGLAATGGELKGFTIAGADNRFVPAGAKIVGGTVIVSAKEVAAPMAVSYGWANVPEVSLFNKDGLPASPFRVAIK